MNDNNIITLNPIWTCCTETIGTQLENILYYEKEYWIKAGGYKKKRVRRILLIEDSGEDYFYFLTGFLPTIFKYLKKNKIPFSYEEENNKTIQIIKKPKIEGISFKPIQSKAIHTVLKHKRGVLKIATAVGKTITAAGIMACLPNTKHLFLCHSRDIVSQTAKSLSEKGFPNVSFFNETKKIGHITCVTDKTFVKHLDEYADQFGSVFVDECHHVSNFNTIYAQILGKVNAEYRIGLSATLSNKSESRMAVEGFLGPVLIDYNVKEAAEAGDVAKPKLITIKSSSVPNEILLDTNNIPIEKGKKLTRYQVVYYNGIATNESRNLQIIGKASRFLKQGLSVLINVVRIDHGCQLLEICKDVGINAHFLYGGVSHKIRDQVKQDFEKKKIRLVIASTVWREGVDVKSIDVCINGAAHKSEIFVMQAFGRGLRITKRKKKVIIVDFDDTSIHKYLAKHTAERKKLYAEMGWIK